MNIFKHSLGSDFWKFRLGQLISLLGDACSGIALSWWVLDKTGSSIALSSVLGPSMALRIFLMPLFGPLGDRYPRKHLIFISDLWRFFFTSLLVFIILLDYFNVILVAILYSLIGVGSSLFQAAAGGFIQKK